MLNNKKILIATGGTGGHINPALAVAGEIRERYPDADGIIFGSEGIDPELEKYCRESGLPVLDFNPATLSDGSYIKEYNSFYDNL